MSQVYDAFNLAVDKAEESSHCRNVVPMNTLQLSCTRLIAGHVGASELLYEQAPVASVAINHVTADRHQSLKKTLEPDQVGVAIALHHNLDDVAQELEIELLDVPSAFGLVPGKLLKSCYHLRQPMHDAVWRDARLWVDPLMLPVAFV